MNIKATFLVSALLASAASAQMSGGSMHDPNTPGGMMSGSGGALMSMGGQGHGAISMASLERLSGAEFERAFMTQMIAHHEVALIMAAIELAHGRDASVRAAAREVIEAQTPEIARLHTWLQKWYGAVPSRAHLMLMMDDLKPMLGAMQDAAARDADRAFLEQMIAHHEGAVRMAEFALARAVKPELKRFADDVIRGQSAEIARYRIMLAQRP